MNLRRAQKRRKLQRVRTLVRASFSLGFLFAGISVGVFALAYLSAGQIYDYEDTVKIGDLPDEVDALVVLAGGGGRILAATDLWYEYWKAEQNPKVTFIDRLARQQGHSSMRNPDSEIEPPPAVFDTPVEMKLPKLYVSGMGPLAGWNVFAQQVRPEVLKVLKPENVILETESANTHENAKWLALYADKYDWHKIILITASYHMRRSKFVFDQTFRGEMEIETYSIHRELINQDNWRSSLDSIRLTLFEYLKWVYYRQIGRGA